MPISRLSFRQLAIASATRLSSTRPFIATTPSVLRRSVLLPILSRPYATPAKPKKGSIGETAQRGRASTRKTTAQAKPKTTKAGSSTKSTAAKKPVNKAAKKPSEAAKARKAAQQQKAKDVAARRKAREQKAKDAAKAKKTAAAARAKARQAKDPKSQVKLLKAQALAPPAVKASSGWIVFWAARARNLPSDGGRTALTSASSAAAQEYRSLSESEKESYARRAKEERARSEQELQAWIEQRSPEEIRKANEARAKLRRLIAPRSRKYSPIRDARAVKQPTGPYLRFYLEQKPGTTGRTSEITKRLAAEWKDLPASQKQRYQDEYEADAKRYAEEYQRVYGSPPRSRASKKKTA